jgi:hypothetical protein
MDPHAVCGGGSVVVEDPQRPLVHVGLLLGEAGRDTASPGVGLMPAGEAAGRVI